MIRFYKVTDPQSVTELISEKIIKHLSVGRVLWLVAGGSSIKTAVAVTKHLAGSKYLSNLTVSLTDERYGPTNHSDSNWKQLLDEGFSLPGAHMLPILHNLSLLETVNYYTKLLIDQLDKSAYSLALAGLGTDGHIFGIKPHSPAIDCKQAVIGYQWPDYVRLTPTINLIKRLDEVIIYARGAQKLTQLDRIEQEQSARDQPAQLLKQVNQVSIYNDYKGEKL